MYYQYNKNEHMSKVGKSISGAGKSAGKGIGDGIGSVSNFGKGIGKGFESIGDFFKSIFNMNLFGEIKNLSYSSSCCLCCLFILYVLSYVS